MKRERYLDLLHELGTLACERFERLPAPPQAFLDVDACWSQNDRLCHEIDALEAQLNEEDESYRKWVEDEKEERKRLEPIIKKWRLAIEGVKAHSQDLRKQMGILTATMRREQRVLEMTLARLRDLEMRSPNEEKRIAELKDVIVRLRLSVLRGKHQLEDRRADLKRATAPQVGQKGEVGVRAYGEALQLELERDRRKHDHADKMARLEAEIARRERRLASLEEESKNAVVALGEECYQERVPDPAFLELVERLDGLRR